MKEIKFNFKSPPLLIFGGGIHQIPYIEYCNKLKIPNLVIDKDPDCLAKEITDHLLNIETPNERSIKVYDSIKKILPNLKICGVLVAGIELAILGTFIAKKFKTKSIKQSVSINATNKITRAKKLKKFNVPSPKFKVYNNLNFNLKDYPFVIKTEADSGSRGVRVISSKENIISAKKDLLKLNSSKFIIEEYLKGHEISIEAFIYKGKFHYYCFAIRDIEIISGGKLIEHGSISDPSYDIKKIKEVKKVFEKACLALGLQEGPAKGDILITDIGPKVIEIAARSAPLAPLISKQIYGFDMIPQHIKWVMNIEPSFKLNIKKYSNTIPVCHRYLLHKKGTLLKLDGIDKLKKNKNVLKIVVLKKLKFPLKLENPDNTNRLLYIVTTGIDAKNAILNAKRCLSKINLFYK